jgi:serine/threonine-protein kinase
VADFGIALAISAAGGGRMTETGLSLGTPHYMSPEQASADRDLSARSDVYSLGCVLYEMLAGQPPHTGPSAQSILVRILTDTPTPLTELRHTVPSHVSAVVQKSIEKLPADRFDSAKDFKDALADTSFVYEAAPTTGGRRAAGASADASRSPAASGAGWTTQARALAATTAFFAVTTVLALSQRGGASADTVPGPTMSFEILRFPPDTWDLPSLVVNDRGDVVTRFFNTDRAVLRLRTAAADSFAVLSGTEDGGTPAFSPDGEWVAFSRWSAPQGVFKTSLSSGVVVPLYETGVTPSNANAGLQPTSLAWGDDGFLYMSPRGPGATVLRLHEDGGVPDTVIHLPDARDLRPRHVLPGGRGLLATLTFNGAESGAHTVVLDLASGDTVSLGQGAIHAQWSETGHVVYAHASGGLFAVPFDLDDLRPTGPPTLVGANVAVGGLQSSSFDISRTGVLVFIRGGNEGATGGFVDELVWLDPDGARPLPIEPLAHGDPDLSGDGSKLVYLRDGRVVVFDLDLGTQTLIQEGGTNVHDPVFSPDGSQVAVFARHADTMGLWVMDASGGGSRRLVNAGSAWLTPSQWLDDTTLLSGTLQRDIYAVDMESGEARPLLTAAWEEANPTVSPDGRWLAFISDEDGIPRVYVRRWPELSDKVQVSDGDDPVRVGNPGSRIQWSEDSRQIFYQQSGEVMVATLDTDGDLTVVSNASTHVEPGAYARMWDRHPRTGEFLMLRAEGSLERGADPDRSIVLVTNWFEELRRRLAEGS